MEVTDVRIKILPRKKDKVKAVATITFDNCFVVRNVKLVEGNNGLFVAMPAEEVKRACPQCNSRIPSNSRFCPRCGAHLGDTPPNYRNTTRDLAHPINQEMREYITQKIISAYQEKLTQGETTGE